MTVVYLIPGSGAGFYCENCIRDLPLVAELKKLGVDVHIIPIYLPLFTDQKSYLNDHGIYLGAVNLFLKYQFPLLKNMPRFISRLLNSRFLLKLVAKFSSSTNSAGLEGLTIDMISGNMPYISHEIQTLIDYLTDSINPDVIHLSNALLIGLGITIKNKMAEKGFSPSLVCSLQDEHTWIEEMKQPWQSQAWKLLQDNAANVDAFFPVSNFYADFMSQRMKLPRQKIHVIPNGIQTSQYENLSPSFDPPVIGYLSRLHRGYGLDLLVDSFLRLKQDSRFAHARLRITGGHTGTDHSFITMIKKRLHPYLLTGEAQIFDRFDLENRKNFLAGMTVLSVPMQEPEAFGMYILEALASGIPVIEPSIGSFPEIIDSTCGLLYNCNEDLLGKLKEILSDREAWTQMGKGARNRAETMYSLPRMAESLKKTYGILSGSGL